MNASSESGLCATVISRTGEDTVPIRFRNPVLQDLAPKIFVLRYPLHQHHTWLRGTRAKSPTRRSPTIFNPIDWPSRRLPAVPASGDPSSHQHLNHFRKNKPIETELESERDG